ncbi:PRTRC system protein B [uncultured Bacteroides sp.]|uniref:PRTRC system protein B n=1 Tax=uncultured Bacteroides sp. TaxID=162156 RepID=UPI0025E92141|nr:PRTRC system protein B [uncultured Bacteroides sp.]
MLETNELTRKLRTLLHPRAALIVYSEENGRHYSGENNHFLEIRDIGKDGKMGEGRPVTVEFMNGLVRGYSERHSTTPYGRIPSNMLWCDSRKGSEKYVWYNPPRKRMMFFKESLKIESAEYHLPGIIYETNGNSLNVYACKDKELTGKTELYVAPFFNVTGASVCLGSAKIEKPKDLTYANLLEYWEKKFWLTEFSHLGGGGNPTKSNLVLVTKAAKDKPFDLEELKPLRNLKLKDILK